MMDGSLLRQRLRLRVKFSVEKLEVVDCPAGKIPEYSAIVQMVLSVTRALDGAARLGDGPTDANYTPLVIPGSETDAPLAHPNRAATKQVLTTDTRDANEEHGCRPRNYSCAESMKRVLSIDVLECPRCGGRTRRISGTCL